MTTSFNHFGASLHGTDRARGSSCESDRATIDSDGTDVKTDAHLTALEKCINVESFNVLVDTTLVNTMEKYRRLAAQALQYFMGRLPGP